METGKIKIEEYIEDLSSKKPIPGGGGASAICAALGISLGCMAANLTAGKKKYLSVSAELEELIKEGRVLGDDFLRLANEDAEAFEPLSRAYSLKKDVPENQKILEECLKAAARPPFETLKKSCKALDILEQFSQLCSPIAISDVATGASICRGALMGAYMNVKVNTRLMSDRAYADKLDEEAKSLVEEYEKKAEEIFWKIMNRR